MKIDFHRPLISVSPQGRRTQIGYVAQQTYRGNKPITDGYHHLLTWGPKLIYVNDEGCPQGSKKPIVMNKRPSAANEDVRGGMANDEVVALLHEALSSIKALSGNVQAIHMKIGLLRRDMILRRDMPAEAIEPELDPHVTAASVMDDMPPVESSGEGPH